MSIEAALAENTAALLKVAGLLEISNAGREAAVAKITQAAEGDKPAGTRGRKPKPTETPAAETPAAPKAPTVEEFMAHAAKFNTFEKGTPQYTAHRDFMKAVLDHTGAAKFNEIPSEDYSKVMGWLDTFKADPTKKVNFSEGEDDAPAAEEDEDDMLS